MRHNIFNEIHTPVRIALLNASVVLQHEGSLNAGETIKKMSAIIHLLNQQLMNEEQFILPLIFDYEPAVWDMYTRQHYKTKNQLRELNVLIHLYEKAELEEEKDYYASSIKDTFHYMMINNYHHMDDEEEVLNEILWRHYSDALLVQIKNQWQTLPVPASHARERKFLQTAYAA